MRSLLSLVLFLNITVAVHCQYKYDYVWMLGDEVDSTYSYYGISKFDFTGGMLKISKQNEGLNMYLSNASIADDDGNLLFYTNGCKVKNYLHQVMENGEGLNPGAAYTTGNCPDGGNSAARGIMILPTQTQGRYLLVHEGAVLGQTSPFVIYIGNLYYSIVDMGANNGLGKVVEKNVPIISDSLYSDLHAVRHANNEDWWVVVSRSHTNTFYKVLLSQDGAFTVETQVIGPNNDPWYSGGGQAIFSPDGTKYARFDNGNQVSLFDFNRATGSLANYQQLFADTFQLFSGLSFSSNSRFLYVSTLYHLYQFDLMADDIQASRVVVADWDGFYDELSGLAALMFEMQLAPDCKIYMTGLSGTRFIHVINRPDEPGLSCDFRQHGIHIPTFNTASIPNFPNYRLGTGHPVCDSNIVYVSGTAFTPSPSVQEIRLWPNPASIKSSSELHLDFALPIAKSATLWLFDATAQYVRQWQLPLGQQHYSFQILGLTDGMYFWRVEGERGIVGSGKLVIIK